MSRSLRPLPAVSLLLLALSQTATAAQAPATQPVAATQPTTQPAGTLAAVVREVRGRVRYATVESPTGNDWKPSRVGDRYLPGTHIRTGFRSHVLLTFADTTVIRIGRQTVVRLAAAQRTAEAERITVDVQYGQIRASVVEREVRSDFTINTPNATLARRGTQGINVYSEAGTGLFRIGLEGSGELFVTNTRTGRSTYVYTQQYTTQLARMWVDAARHDRHVSVSGDVAPDEVGIEVSQNSGFGGTGPPGTGQGDRASFAGVAGGFRQPPPSPPPMRRSTFMIFPDGNFGFGGVNSLSTQTIRQGAARSRFANARGRSWLGRIGRRSRVNLR